MNLSESVVVIADDSNTTFLNFARESLEVLISTPEGTAPLDRNFGLNQSFLSLPPDTAKTLFAQELITKVEMYIPEISITEIDITVDSDGILRPVITVCKNDDYAEIKDEDTNLSTDEDSFYYDDQDPDADNYIEGEDNI